MEGIYIRKAKPTDIEQIASLKVSGWKNTYANIIDKDYLDQMKVSDEIQKYNNQYSLDTVFVAEKQGEIICFCRIYDFEASPYPELDADCEIREIYVRTDLKRMGIGSSMFKYVLNYFKEKGKKKLYLGVFEDNDNSRKFYEKMGGVIGLKTNLKMKEKSYSVVTYTFTI